MSADISFIIVNFNSGDYLAGCIDSLRNQSLNGLESELLVVDCASTIDQADRLDEARRRGARILELDRNLGYAGGCNHGLAHSSGKIVFFLNADIIALDGCILPLAEMLSGRKDIGIVEPKTFLDAECRFMIPEIHELNAKELFLGGLARVSGRWAQRMSLRRVRRTLPMWSTHEPTAMPTLTGAFLGMRREVIDEVGGFDENYILFYEDSDLFKRVRRAGYRLMLNPQARAVHFGHRSAVTVWDEAMSKHRQSRELFIRQHLGAFVSMGNNVMEWVVAKIQRSRAPEPCLKFIELGEVIEPPHFTWTGSSENHLIELAFDPYFHLAAATFSQGSDFYCPSTFWNTLIPGEYFFRAVDMAELNECARWRLIKK